MLKLFNCADVVKIFEETGCIGDTDSPPFADWEFFMASFDALCRKLMLIFQGKFSDEAHFELS